MKKALSPLKDTSQAEECLQTVESVVVEETVKTEANFSTLDTTDTRTQEA